MYVYVYIYIYVCVCVCVPMIYMQNSVCANTFALRT